MIPKLLTPCLLISTLLYTPILKGQCDAPPPPPAKSLTDPAASDGETLANGTTKWYKATGTYNSLTLKGGTFIVDGNLTINNLTIEWGELYIRPGASLTVGGTGIILNGNARIYNYGTLTVLANFYMLGTPTITTPSCLVNATATSNFSMPNQYFMIDAPNSYFINNGKAQIGGLQTWYNSKPGSVILNDKSETKLLYIFNQIDNAYVTPSGTACVSVQTSSQVAKKITSSPTLNLALGVSHKCNSCISSPWGDAQVFTNTPSCSGITPLPVHISNFRLTKMEACHLFNWQSEIESENGYFILEYSTNGIDYLEKATINQHSAAAYQYNDCAPLKGITYYRLKWINSQTEKTTYSETITSKNFTFNSATTYPNPFVNQFSVTLSNHSSLKYEWNMCNSTGQSIPVTVIKQNQALLIHTPENLPTGLYFFQLRTDTDTYQFNLLKK